MYDYRDQKAKRIDEDVALAAVDLLARGVAVWPPFSVVFTDWLSITPALGFRFRPTASRKSPWSWSWILSQVPSFFHVEK